MCWTSADTCGPAAHLFIEQSLPELFSVPGEPCIQGIKQRSTTSQLWTMNPFGCKFVRVRACCFMHSNKIAGALIQNDLVQNALIQNALTQHAAWLLYNGVYCGPCVHSKRSLGAGSICQLCSQLIARPVALSTAVVKCMPAICNAAGLVSSWLHCNLQLHTSCDTRSMQV